MKTKPRVKPHEAERVLSGLSHGHWEKGRSLANRLRIPGRTIRAVAEQTGEIISGQKGYKLACEATNDELTAAQADLLSRSRHLQARADLIQRHLHQRQQNRLKARQAVELML